jgi:CRP-like cAMP-binding protein
MYPIFGTPDPYDVLSKENKRLLQEIVASLKPHEKDKMLSAQQTLYEGGEGHDMLYVVKEGIISCELDERVLYFYDCGDLVGLEQLVEGSESALKTDFAVIVDEYSVDSITAAMHDSTIARKWMRYLANRQELLNIMISVTAQKDLDMQPEPITLQPEEIIISQGTTGTDVFTLVEGLLEVVVDGVKVGEIMPDEIFGAMAALTETPRSATVRAVDFSVILKLPRERVLDLMRSRPLTVLKMIEDMSRTIVSLNERVVKLSEEA